MEQKNIKVLNKYGQELSPCNEKIAWVLVTRKRAIKINDECIKLIVDKNDLKKLRKKAIERDGRICLYCGRYIPENEKATVDHLDPKHVFKDGVVGYDSLDNLACCCEDCNSHKGSRGFNEYCSFRISVVAAAYSMKTGVGVNNILANLTNIRGNNTNEDRIRELQAYC